MVLNEIYVKCTKIPLNLVALNMSGGKLKLKWCQKKIDLKKKSFSLGRREYFIFGLAIRGVFVPNFWFLAKIELNMNKSSIGT